MMRPLFLAAVISIAAGTLGRGQAAAAGQSATDPANLGGTSETKAPSATPASVVLDAAWIEAHTAPIVVTQNHSEDAYRSGAVSYRGLTAELPETPPVYQYNLASVAGPLLFGSTYTRHERTCCFDRVGVGRLGVRTYPEINLTVPPESAEFGFLLRRDELPIQTIGVILPNLDPSGKARRWEEWYFEVRVCAFNHGFGPECFGDLEPTEIGPDYIVLCGPDAVRPLAARVVWMRYEEDGGLRPVDPKISELMRKTMAEWTGRPDWSWPAPEHPE